jgi:hypothetical protein
LSGGGGGGGGGFSSSPSVACIWVYRRLVSTWSEEQENIKVFRAMAVMAKIVFFMVLLILSFRKRVAVRRGSE